MGKKILQLGAGHLQLHSITQWKNAGYEVHVLDKCMDAPGFNCANAYSNIDIIDTAAIINYARENKIDAIIAVNDAGAVPAADASEALGLKGVSPQTARLSTDKGLMRETWKLKALSQPKFIIVNSSELIKQAITDLGFPVIIKPCLNWGSKGVASVMKYDDIEFAIEFTLKNDRNGRFIIEELIQGTEMTYEGLVKDGHVQILSRSDKVHQQHQHFNVAMELNYPPAISEKLITLADILVVDAAKALNIINGALHCELMVNETGAYLVEMASRPGGGHIFGQIVEAQCGVPMPLSLAKIFLNEEVDITPQFQKGVSYRFFSPPHGVFHGVEGIEEAALMKGVIDLGFSMAPGTIVDDFSGDADRPGYLVTVAETRQGAIDTANKVVNALNFKANNIL